MTPDPIDAPGTPPARGPGPHGGRCGVRPPGPPRGRRRVRQLGDRLPADHRGSGGGRRPRGRTAAHGRRRPRARRGEHGARLLLRHGSGPGGDAAHERRAVERCDRRDQRGDRPRADAPDVGSDPHGRRGSVRCPDRAHRVGPGDARSAGTRPRGMQVGLRAAVPRAGATAARPGLRDRRVDTTGTGLPRTAARGAVRTVPERRARPCARHGRGARRRAAFAVGRRR